MTDEKKEVKIESVSIDDASENTTANVTTDSEIEKLNVQLAEMNDKYLRLAAELENTRRRSELDAQSRARNRAMSVAQKILPVMDAVNAALKHSPDDEGTRCGSLSCCTCRSALRSPNVSRRQIRRSAITLSSSAAP